MSSLKRKYYLDSNCVAHDSSNKEVVVKQLRLASRFGVRSQVDTGQRGVADKLLVVFFVSEIGLSACQRLDDHMDL